MAGKPLGETGVTITTAMLTSAVRIDHVFKDFRLGKNALYLYFFDYHIRSPAFSLVT
jgi:hypothetical protein